ncbi:MATE family efflux transporter [Alteromonas sediminis]|uniref:MATE family efflux transporter n=2 Tax=Alteromonas sediminis TaxID=2259342 RepID=A0A3N5Y2B2_9ALTE|nr:MATE family efflux transporter [Alteromonas sediminis]RPJ66816.1 MATE family efflux transporter [Alteromonas sediminis]
MVLANITTPLVGLVDTAVLGRMDAPSALAGASIGALIITQIVWICGFLRMSTTGLSAQAYGAQSKQEQAKVLYQGVFIGLLLAAVLLLLHRYIFNAGLHLSELSGEAKLAAEAYFTTRIWGLPAAMTNLALVGWMIGRHLTRQVLYIQITGNLLNAGLNIAFVYGLGWQVEGVAFATVLAEYTLMLLSILVCRRHIQGAGVERTWFSMKALKNVLSLNTSMFLRNLVLQICLAFLTLQGARYGVTAAAVNAIVLQFFALIALGLDGIAFGVEAMVGKAAGRKASAMLRTDILVGVFWSGLIACIYAFVFAIAGDSIAALLTEHHNVLNALSAYSLVIILLPLIGHWCFLFDGVAIGLTQASAMRNTMFVSAVAGFFPVWWFFKDSGNIALWYAMLSFLALRGLTLGVSIVRRYLL